METVLYSCFGTTDPVRGMRDGGLLHILRHSDPRPEAVYLFLSKEITERDKVDNRIDKTFAYIRDHWDGYAPKVIRKNVDIEDPSDMDALLEPMHGLLEQIQQEHPAAKILINLSSGTPQMQIILAQMAMDTRYIAEGIQVKSPERASGTEERTNTKNFSVEDALETNFDEDGDGPNRCVRPEMLAIRREAVKNEVRSLLSQRNYAAIAQMGADLPGSVVRLAKHLDYRSRFLLEEAEKAAAGLSEYNLQIGKGVYSYPDYELIEYFSMLKYLVDLGRYTDFILRLNPFIVRLQRKILFPLLVKYRIRESELFEEAGKELIIKRQRLEANHPRLLDYIEDKMGKTFKDAPANILTLNMMLTYFQADGDAMNILSICEKCNQKLRNSAAHTLFTITNEGIQRICGIKAEEMIKRLEQILINVMRPYGDKNLRRRLNIYARCDERIEAECRL